MKVLLHGVPDTAALWQPLIAELSLAEGAYHAPNLPGFGCDLPAGFEATADGYVNWFIRELDSLYKVHGPLDLVGHDWGAIIVSRAASLAPQLTRTWTIANAAAHPDYKWHRMARLWQTPLVGEAITLMTRPSALKKALIGQGLPEHLAAHEAAAMDGTMKRSILSLYRSAKTIGTDWDAGFDKISSRGLIFWGVDDPYVPVWVAEAFAQRTGAQLKKIEQTGHWSVVQKAADLAMTLDALWAQAD